MRVVEVQARPGFKLWLQYSDGAQGEVDLSDLAGRGVFAAWNDPAAFECVRIGTGGEVVWDAGVDLCPDMLYMWLTGKTPEQVFPALAISAAE